MVHLVTFAAQMHCGPTDDAMGFCNARNKAFPSTKHPVQLKPVSSEKTVFVSNIPKQGLGEARTRGKDRGMRKTQHSRVGLKNIKLADMIVDRPLALPASWQN